MAARILLVALLGLVCASEPGTAAHAAYGPRRPAVARAFRLRATGTAPASTAESPGPAARGDDAQRWATLGSLCAQDLPLIALSTAFMVAAAVSEASLPHYTSAALFAATSGAPRAHVGGALRRLVGVGLAAALFTGARGCAFWIAGARVLRRLRSRLFAALLAKPAHFFDAHESSTLSSRLSSDVGKISDVVSFNVNVIARQSIQAVVALAWLVRIHAQLSLVLVSGLLLTFAANQLYSHANRELSRSTQTEVARAATVATEDFRLIRTIKVYSTEAREAARYDASCQRIEDLQDAQGRLYGSARVVNGALALLLSVLVLARGAHLCAAGALSAQQLTTFVLSSATITGATIGIGEQWVKVQEALGAAEDIFALIQPDGGRAPDGLLRSSGIDARLAPAAPLRLVPTAALALAGSASAAGARAAEPAAAVMLPARPAALELESVRFAYPSRSGSDVLRSLSLRVPEGQLAAIVGASGSGKSTVMRLLCGLYDQAEGSVKVLGDELRSLSQHELASRVAWLPQEPQLFSGTIRDNIAYGLPPGSFCDADVLRAAAQANADGFIEQLGGLGAQVGEAGARLSGGQRQRVAVARALMRGAQVLLLDEPTSALDPTSERLLQDCVLGLVPERTVLVVAHRISTVQRADVIFVMEAGAVVEQGTHAALLAEGGTYARLVSCL
ncbi:hypothetical protein KFE25_010543 [Diacronema lutheri]|mgnify:CR=1 FL=1|uniref:ATP-dependent transporter ycf16 n=3 Tax=Diacronema lutheri TaxID=2081491 RepID=A0A8J5X9I9_DIALT|nr:hypothetical protein KFE25_010543 [Diacronema lutheri]